MEELLKNTPPFVWTLGVFAALLLARELGNRLARRIRVNDEIEQGHVISGVLGLLALLIAFTFGMALNRYEARGDLMVKEANAIATAAMRVRMLEPPHAARLGGLHREYADMRVRYGLMTADKKLPLREASRALRARIQTDVLQTLAPIRETALSASILSAVSDVAGVAVERDQAHDSIIPIAVLGALVGSAMLAAGVVGATLRDHRGLSDLMFVLLALALGVIFDLDHPQRGAIPESQAAMIRMVEDLAGAATVAVAR